MTPLGSSSSDLMLSSKHPIMHHSFVASGLDLILPVEVLAPGGQEVCVCFPWPSPILWMSWPGSLIGSLAPGRAPGTCCLPSNHFSEVQGLQIVTGLCLLSLSGEMPSRGCEECGPKEILVPYPRSPSYCLR